MKTALVLSGGGARGAYEVGVWRALNELNINCDIVTGVSIGSINAALYAQGSLENAINLWKNISFNTVFPCDELPKTSKELRKKYFSSIRDGGAEPSNLKENLLSCIDVDKIYESNIDYGLMTVKYPKMQKLELTKSKIAKEDFVDYLIASSTIYPVFQVKEIENEKYIDGGYINSVPFELAKKMGAEKYIIVNISVMKKRYKPEKDSNIIFIKPNNKLGSPIVFDSNVAKINLEYGYNDTMKVFKKLYGKKYTFKNMNYKKNNIFSTYDKYLNTLDYLGLSFGINDHLIYTIEKYNKLLNEKISKISINDKLTLKDFDTRSERIMFVYNRLINNKVVRQNNKKRVINIEYRCAYYLYYNFYLKTKEN